MLAPEWLAFVGLALVAPIVAKWLDDRDRRARRASERPRGSEER
jgi:hypothetical protein